MCAIIFVMSPLFVCVFFLVGLCSVLQYAFVIYRLNRTFIIPKIENVCNLKVSPDSYLVYYIHIKWLNFIISEAPLVQHITVSQLSSYSESS